MLIRDDVLQQKQKVFQLQLPPEAETLFAFERSMKAANSSIFLKFGNAENHRYLGCFRKKIKFSRLQNVVTD